MSRVVLQARSELQNPTISTSQYAREGRCPQPNTPSRVPFLQHATSSSRLHRPSLHPSIHLFEPLKSLPPQTHNNHKHRQERERGYGRTAAPFGRGRRQCHRHSSLPSSSSLSSSSLSSSSSLTTASVQINEGTPHCHCHCRSLTHSLPFTH